MRFSSLAVPSLLWAAGEVLAGKLSLTDTITWGGDNSRTGYSSTHNMDPAVVGSSQFGQLWKALLPGNYRGNPEQIFSQPLVYTLDDGVQYVFIATTQNNVYKLNAKTGAIVASRSLHVPFLTLDLDGCVDINPTIGVTATGVIDASTDTWYLTAKTYVDQSDAVKGRLNGRYWYHAIDVNTLAEKDGFPKNLEGTIARNNRNRMFQGGNAHQRPALLLSGQYVYAGFASHCVQYNFTGWIMGWDKTSGALVERFATQGGPEPNTVPGGGVWMSGGGLASDNKGSMFYATGNGYASQLSTTPVPGRQPPTALEEAAVNMKINSDGSLSVVDFFMPWEKTQLDGADKDLGTSPLELLQTDVFTCPNVKRLGVVTGKSGKTYWLNLDNLGGYQQGANKLDAVPQVTQNENSVYAGAGVYPLEGGYIYINVIQVSRFLGEASDHVKSLEVMIRGAKLPMSEYPTHIFKFSCNANGDPVFTKVADSPQKNAYILGVGHGTTTSLNGQPGTGLVWVSDVEGSNLRVYKAVPQNGFLELINSANIAGVTKFTRPVFGDGRAYIGTTLGALYCFGSPVNLPLTCSSPNDFGNVLINSTSAVKTIQCKANINTQVTGIALNGNPNFQLTGKPTLPLTVTAGNNVSFQATFRPVSPGPLSSDVLLNTTNGVAGYALTTPVSLTGVGDSANPLLAVSPNTVSFTGVITGQQEGGVTQSIIFSNQGDGPLTILGLDYSVISETGAFVQPTSTPDGPKVGPFTFKDLPTSIPANGQAIVDIVFDPSTSGNFAVYVHLRSDGGTKIFDVFGTAGTNPVALLEFQAADGSGAWIEYSHNSPPFTFGNVYEQQTKVLKMRLTNKGESSAASLSVTVSKPPFGVPGIIGALNQVDLGEGTVLGAGESATASLFCSVPKSQVNVDSYSGTALWTLNVGDPNFGKQFINFTCNAVAEQLGPLYPNGSATYRYAGCYKENNPGRQLQTQLYTSQDNNTNDRCIAACAAQRYTFAGTQYITECWCGNNIPILKTTEADCNYACSGNPNETCGGNGYFHDGVFISLFANGPGGSSPTSSGGPAVVPSVGAFNYIGCYTEAANGRALSAQTLNTQDMTIERCAGNCTSYQYFGVEYGSECYCGNTLGAGSKKAADSDCSMTCPGNSTELCGNGNRLTLYTAAGHDALSSSSTPLLSANPTSASVSAPTPTGPVTVQSAGNFNYTGCYTEATTGRALTGSTLANDAMTVEKCAGFCAAYTYMGIEYASECYCGNTIAAGAVLAASGCSMTCSGNSSEFCGGPNRLNFYTVNSAGPGSSSAVPTSTSPSVTTPTGPITVKAAGNFNYTGCYTEATTGRALTGSTLANNAMTVEKCAAFCSAYTYMGIEYANECYCGNTIAAGAALAASGCSMTCSGNSSEYCGGPNRLNFYTVNAAAPGTITVSTISAGTTTSSTTNPVSTPIGPIIVTGDANFTYLGCYVEPANSRALSTLVLDKPQMTVEICLSACSQYTYAGLEYRSECWCGMTLAAAATKATAESQCGLTCAGNSSEICGAGNRLTVYTKTPLQVSSSASSSSIVSGTSSISQTTTTLSGSSSFSVTSVSLTSTVTSGLLSSSLSSALSSSSAASSSSLTSTSGSLSNSATLASSSSATSGSSSIVTSNSIDSALALSSSGGSSGSAASATTGSSSFSSSVQSLPSSLTTTSGSSAMSTSASLSSTNSGSLQSSSSVSSSQSRSSSSVSPTLSLFSSATSVPSTFSTSIVPSSQSASSSDTAAVSSTLSSSSSSATTSSSASSSSTTLVSSSASLSVPTPGQTVNSYVYLGCFNETTPRALVGAYKTDNRTTTNAACQETCKDQNYGLAATESGDTCACGNGLQSYSAPVLQAFCNTPCVGNVSEICGGSGDAKYLSVWNSTSSNIPPTQVKAVGAYPLKGCYNDTLNAHAFNETTYTNSTGMSVEACVGYCITKNYDVAGLENGQTCFCSSTLASSVNSTFAAQCNMPCTGNQRELCGAYDKLLVYKKDSSSVSADGVPAVVNQDNSAIIVANKTAPA